MKIYTLEEFNDIFDTHRKQTMGKVYFKKDWKLTKLKTVKQTQRKTIFVNDIPQMEITNRTAKEVVDTNKVTEMYICFAKLMYGYELFRISSEGRYREGKNGERGFWLKGLNNGHADIEGCVDGLIVCIEVKQPNESRKDSQVKYQAYIERSKGFYRIARNFEQYQVILGKLKAIVDKRINL